MTTGPALRLEMSGETTPATLEEIQRFVEEGCRRAGAGDGVAFDMRLAVDEACTNIAEHGYGGKPGPIGLVLEARPGEFRVAITDRARPFAPERVPAADVSADLEAREPGGLGWHLIRQVTDEVAYKSDPGQGNCLILTRRTSLVG